MCVRLVISVTFKQNIIQLFLFTKMLSCSCSFFFFLGVMINGTLPHVIPFNIMSAWLLLTINHSSRLCIYTHSFVLHFTQPTTLMISSNSFLMYSFWNICIFYILVSFRQDHPKWELIPFVWVSCSCLYCLQWVSAVPMMVHSRLSVPLSAPIATPKLPSQVSLSPSLS